MRRAATTLAALAALAALAGCGAPTASHQPPAPTARQVLAALQLRGVPIAHVSVYTPATDPNRLMGRPGQYVAKAGYLDRRLDPSLDASRGSVEVFRTAGDAHARAAYVQAVTAHLGPLGVEYDYQRGPVLLRVPGQLTPAQAAGYRRALAAVRA